MGLDAGPSFKGNNMREIQLENLSKLSVKKTPYIKAIGQDIIYICTHCEYTEKEYALTSRNYKHCGKCGYISVKSNLLATINWVESDIQPPNNISGE